MDKSKKRFSIIPNYGNPNDLNVRAKYGYLEASVSIIGNVLLFFLKLILGLFINSIALITDAIHSLSDIGTSGVVIFGFKISKKPPDKEHPYGHGRVEYIGTLIIAILLVIVGLGLIEQSIKRIINSENLLNTDYALLIGIVIIITSLAKEIMAQFSFNIGNKINSDILKADAWHHRSDAVSSVAVGISIIGSNYGFPILDPIFGIVVSIIIIYIGINLIKKASDLLIGQAPDKETIEKIRDIAELDKDVKGIHDISIHDYVGTKVVSLHLEVENDLTLDESHKIADKISDKIEEKMNLSTIIHLDPKELHIDEKLSKLLIESILKKQEQIISFHKIQLIRRGDKENISIHIIVDRKMQIGDSHDFCHKLESIIQNEYGECKVDFHLEPCGEDCEVCKLTCRNRIF